MQTPPAYLGPPQSHQGRTYWAFLLTQQTSDLTLPSALHQSRVDQAVQSGSWPVVRLAPAQTYYQFWNFSLFLLNCLQTASHRLQTLAKMTLRHSANYLQHKNTGLGLTWANWPNLQFQISWAKKPGIVILWICSKYVKFHWVKCDIIIITLAYVGFNQIRRHETKTKCSFFRSIWCLVLVGQPLWYMNNWHKHVPSANCSLSML